MSEPRRIPRLMIFLMILVSVAVILLWMSGKAQAEDPAINLTFGGGISKRQTDFTLKPNQAVSIINFNIEAGSISKREGYWKAADGLYGGDRDSVLGVYGLRKRDGSQKLLRVVGDSVGNWGNIWTGSLGSATKHTTWLCPSGTFDFTTWKDYAFICDGANFPWVTSGKDAAGETHSLHALAPGEFSVEVTDDSVSNLDGTYRWAILAYPNCDTTTALCGGVTDTARARCLSRHVGYISPEVTVHHRAVAIHIFWPSVADSGCAAPLPLKFYLCRTAANKNRLGINVSPINVWSDDSLNVIQPIVGFPDSFTVNGSTCLTTIVYDSGAIATDGFALAHEGYDVTPPNDSFAMNGTPRLLDDLPCDDTLPTNVHNAYFRYTGYDTSDVAGPRHVYEHGVNYYAMTLADTVLNVESDTSRNLHTAFGHHDSLLVISLPDVPAGMTNCVRRIYRGTTAVTGPLPSGITLDSITALYLIATIKGADTSFTDTVSNAHIFDSLYDDHPIFVKKSHFRFAGSTVWKDRLYGWTGPWLYYSAKDTAAFKMLDFIAFGADDGDAITSVMGDRNRLLVYTSGARHEVYEDPNGEFSKSSPPYITSGVGCISARSMQSWRGARVYLSRFGVIYEVGSALQEKGNQIDTISMGVQSILDGWSYGDRCRAVGFIFDDDKYVLSVPGHDTTFVCFLDEPGFPWAMYTPFSFTGATLYEDDDDYILRPPVEIVFSKAGDDEVYRWGDSLTDNGSRYSAEYKTGILGMGPDLTDIYQALFIGKGPDTTNATFRFLDIDGDTLGTVTLAADTNRLEKRSVKLGQQEQAYQFEISVDSTARTFTMDAISLWLRFFGLSGPEK